MFITVLCLFQEVSRLDLVSDRGKRSVFNGLQTTEAVGIIEQFEFDKNQPFTAFFPFKCIVDMAEGKLKVLNFSCALLKKPQGATHVSLQFIMVGLDFEMQSSFVQNVSVVLDVSLDDDLVTDLELTCDLPQSPYVFGLLYVGFFQSINSERYCLKSGGLKIVGVF